jgi:hypothetical protein
MELIRNFARVVLGISLLALSGCGEPTYSRVQVTKEGVFSGVDEVGLTRAACELTVMNSGRFQRTLPIHSECILDAVAASEVKKLEAKEKAAAVQKVAAAAEKAAAEKAAEVAKSKTAMEEAAEVQRRTDALLKRTEGLAVMTPPVAYPVGPARTEQPTHVPAPAKRTELVQSEVKPWVASPVGVVFGADYTKNSADGRLVIVDAKTTFSFSQGENFAFVATFSRVVMRLDCSIETLDKRRVLQWMVPDVFAATHAERVTAKSMAALPVGEYRMVLRNGAEVMASGEFSVR